MTREGLVKHWEVVEAFKNGLNIERMSHGEWVDADEPSFSVNFEYRIKKDHKYVPFDFGDAEKLIGRCVKSNDGQKYINTIIAVADQSVLVGTLWHTYKNLLNEFQFLDGSVCGKLK